MSTRMRGLASEHRLYIIFMTALALLGGDGALGCTCLPVSNGFLIPDSIEVPANFGGIPWCGYAGGGHRPEQRMFVLERRRGNGWVFVPLHLQFIEDSPVSSSGSLWQSPHGFMLLVIAEERWRVGAEYRARFTGPGLVSGARMVVLRVVNTRLIPDDSRIQVRIGSAARCPLAVLSTGGSCSAGITAVQRRLDVLLTSRWERFREALLFATCVDGEFWRPTHSLCASIPPGLSWLGRGQELVFAACPRKPSRENEAMEAPPDMILTLGKHRIEMVAWLPGTQVVAHVATDIELSCE